MDEWPESRTRIGDAALAVLERQDVGEETRAMFLQLAERAGDPWPLAPAHDETEGPGPAISADDTVKVDREVDRYDENSAFIPALSKPRSWWRRALVLAAAGLAIAGIAVSAAPGGGRARPVYYQLARPATVSDAEQQCLGAGDRWANSACQPYQPPPPAFRHVAVHSTPVSPPAMG